MSELPGDISWSPIRYFPDCDRARIKKPAQQRCISPTKFCIHKKIFACRFAQKRCGRAYFREIYWCSAMKYQFFDIATARAKFDRFSANLSVCWSQSSRNCCVAKVVYASSHRLGACFTHLLMRNGQIGVIDTKRICMFLLIHIRTATERYFPWL